MALDLNKIKDELKLIFEVANDDAGDPVPLSQNMTRDVQCVLKLNPELHQIQSSAVPAVTIWTDIKNIELDTIGRDQINCDRSAKIDFKIAGIVWNDNYKEFSEDPADEDCERLMENIEDILRNNPTINSTCLWQFPTSVTYHSFSLNEETHYRVGIMNLEVTVRY